MMLLLYWCRGCWWLCTLVALGKEPEGVDLLHEVGHARPSSESKSSHQHPDHHKHVHCIHPSPAWQEKGWLLCCILQLIKQNIQTVEF